MTPRQRAVGMFHNSLDTEIALKELDNSHFSLDRVFVIARNTENEDKIVDTQLCESLRNRFHARISSRIEPDSNSVEDVMSLTNALIHLDIPMDIARQYNDLVARGKYLVIIEGNEDDIKGAKSILNRCGIEEWVVYKIVLEYPEVIIVDRRRDRS